MIGFLKSASAEQREEMPRWFKVVSRAIGALDSILSVFGLYLFIDPISRGLLALNAPSSANAPYFRTAFMTMILINGVLLILFVFASVQLLRLSKSGLTVHTTASVLLVAYDILVATLWTTGGPMGMSVAAATGVGNMGIAPFNLVPYVYPVASTVLLLIAHRKRTAAMQTRSSIV